MVSAHPSIRNNWTRVAMRRIRTFGDAERRLVLDAIPKASQDAIAKAKNDDWLVAEHAIAVCEALHTHLGIDASVEFWRGIVFDSYAGGLLEQLILDQRENADLLSLAPKAWELSAQHAGFIGVEPGPTGLRLVGRELPIEMRESLGVQAMFAGAVRAILGFSKLDADVVFEGDPGDGTIGFAVRLR